MVLIHPPFLADGGRSSQRREILLNGFLMHGLDPVFVIQSDDANCQSADPDRNTRILCGYRLLEYIAYTIVDFPIGIDEDQEAQIDDYEQALLDVRSWFAQNPEYELVKAVY